MWANSMGSNNHISTFKRSVFLSLALMALLTGMCQYNFQYFNSIDAVTSEIDELPNQDEHADEEGKQFSILAYEAIVPLIQLNLSQELYFIIDLTLLKEIELEEDFETPLYYSTYLKRLFRLIISANAP